MCIILVYMRWKHNHKNLKTKSQNPSHKKFQNLRFWFYFYKLYTLLPSSSIIVIESSLKNRYGFQVLINFGMKKHKGGLTSPFWDTMKFLLRKMPGTAVVLLSPSRRLIIFRIWRVVFGGVLFRFVAFETFCFTLELLYLIPIF